MVARLSKEKQQQVREKILQVAYPLFMEKGFEQTRTRDISEAAGIAEGTLFNYYPSKESLFLECMADHYDASETPAAFSSEPGASAVEQVTSFMLHRFQSYFLLPRGVLKEMASLILKLSRKKPSVFQKLLAADFKAVGELEKLLETLVEKKLLLPCDTELAASVLFSFVVYDYLSYLYVKDQTKEQTLRVIREKIAFALAGWLPQE